MKGEAILDIHVVGHGENICFATELGEVCLIPFAGTVSGPLFEGIVEPCGVDVQRVNAAGVRHMSARYVLTGKDREGRDAHIFVENEGWFDDERKQMPFRTVPGFRTDSKALAGYLHTARFVGEGSMQDDGLHIRFYEVSDGDTSEVTDHA